MTLQFMQPVRVHPKIQTKVQAPILLKGSKNQFQKYFLEMIWPAWVYCTRYSDRPSAGPRAKRTRKKEGMSSLKIYVQTKESNI